ncbi:MAG: lipid A export permease/ATP-binding protein MsbA [Desulfuromonadales bacterium]|nr:lipid A export permease/ATP-binding protein MsbA [Desulfuromonadales bacterium]MDW7756454.1 lipid A export permease/ATP-binding protein MsbA [Desulfuromonadales bacterium]
MKSKGTQVYLRLLGYTRTCRWRIIFSMVASLGVAGSDAAAAKLIQPFIDRLVVAGDVSLVNLVPVFVLGLAAIKGVSRFVQEYYIKTAGQLVMQDLRNDLFGHSLHLGMRYYSKTSSGTLMSRILNDVTVMQAAVAEVLVGLLREGLTLVALTLVAFYGDWQLTLMAFVVLPLAAWPASRIGKKIKQYTRSGQSAMGTLTQVLEQTFSGIKVIKAFGTEEREVGRFRDRNLFYYRFLRKVIKYDAASSPVMEIMSSFGVAAVLWFGLHRVMSGGMTQGELFSVIGAIMFMYTPAKRLSKMYNRIQQAIGAAERVFELLETPHEIVDRPGAKPLTHVRGDVRFDHVSFSYGDEPILQDVSLIARQGEVVALVGPSGAGKSTIVSLLNRFYDPQSGAVLIDGQDIRDLTLDSLKAHIAMVDQETFLFNDTLANNIRYGRPEASDEEVAEAARQAYADQFIQTLPEGFETEIGDRGLRLSGGQRQRICIARAILKNAPILILDEATSALDTESEAMVQQALTNLMQNRTTFVVAHRLSTILHADKIVVLEQGRVCEVGRHEELLAHGGLYKKLYDMQFQS